MLTLFYFIVAISLLVVIHEYGHFWVARRCGVQVKRFSVGFGKPLFTLRDKQGTEFSIAPIPLGGYVSMLDEREAPVPEALQHMAFNRKTPLQRIAIAVAGPAANFIFAILAYWFIFMVGTTGLAPVIGAVVDDSPAASHSLRAGDEIVAVNQVATSTWEEVNWQLLRFIGESGEITLTLKAEQGGRYQLALPIERWLGDGEISSPLLALGIEPRRLPIPAELGQLSADGAAQRAGLQTGDLIVAVDGYPINDWYGLVEVIQASAEQTRVFSIERQGRSSQIAVTPAQRVTETGQVQGFIGAGVAVPSYPQDWLRTRHAGFIEGLSLAAQKTWDTTIFTLDALWKMIVGQLSVKNLSGPVSIAKVAGASAAGGLEAFVGFLALLSISLGVLNLLPIPVLDGGHIMLCVAEMVKGKPVSEKTQEFAVRIGMFLLLGLMLVAFYNDLSRL